MPDVLVVGGTRFIGRHTVREFRDAGYGVTLLTRGDHDNPFAADDRVAHVRGDRRERAAAERGQPGEAYHAADRRAFTLDETLERIAGALGTEVDPSTPAPATSPARASRPRTSSTSATTRR